MADRVAILEGNLRAVRKSIYALCCALNFSPSRQQRELLDAVQRREPAIACKSGQGPGKTKVSGVIALWWALQRQGTLVVLTAPTMRQCSDVWLAELKRTMASADAWLRALVEVTTQRAIIGGEREWGVRALTATSDEAAQGFHHPNMKVILEEASGISRKIVEQFQGTLKNPNAAMLLIGNPNTRDCYFFDCFHSKKQSWHRLTMNAEHTPASPWFDPGQNLKLEEEYGRDSDVYRIRVLGEFPHSDPKCVLSSEEVEASFEKARLLPMVVASKAKQFGIDLARMGGDENTVYRRSGEAIVEKWRRPHVEPIEAIRKAMEWQAEAGWRDEECLYVPDVAGLGGGVVFSLHEAGKRVLEFNGAHASSNIQYGNRATQAWFEFRTKLRNKAWYMPADQVCLQQLTTRRYFINKKGRIVLETKEEYVKRGFDSPDRADGTIMAAFDGQWAPGTLVHLPDRATKRLGVA